MYPRSRQSAQHLLRLRILQDYQFNVDCNDLSNPNTKHSCLDDILTHLGNTILAHIQQSQLDFLLMGSLMT